MVQTTLSRDNLQLKTTNEERSVDGNSRYHTCMKSEMAGWSPDQDMIRDATYFTNSPWGFSFEAIHWIVAIKIP